MWEKDLDRGLTASTKETEWGMEGQIFWMIFANTHKPCGVGGLQIVPGDLPPNSRSGVM